MKVSDENKFQILKTVYEERRKEIEASQAMGSRSIAAWAPCGGVLKREW